MEDSVQDRLVRFGQRVRLRREALGVSQAELARRVEVSERTLRSIEQGRDHTISTALRIADVLGIGIDRDDPTEPR